MKKILIITLLLVLTVSCRKNQQSINHKESKKENVTSVVEHESKEDSPHIKNSTENNQEKCLKNNFSIISALIEEDGIDLSVTNDSQNNALKLSKEYKLNQIINLIENQKEEL
ncbi:MAG: hypothetical protein ISR65_17250 [Bacteriovoracaceae bacterium]|nr:hypothetical protein [Bacteriovoracaceae bacterium]